MTKRTRRRVGSAAPDKARKVKSGSHRLLLGVVPLVLVGVLTYWNSLSGPFLFDDQRSIVENPSIPRDRCSRY